MVEATTSTGTTNLSIYSPNSLSLGLVSHEELTSEFSEPITINCDVSSGGCMAMFGDTGVDQITGIAKLDSNRIVFCGNSTSAPAATDSTAAILGLATISSNSIQVNKIIMIIGVDYTECVSIVALNSTQVLYSCHTKCSSGRGWADGVLGLVTIGMGDLVTLNSVVKFDFFTKDMVVVTPTQIIILGGYFLKNNISTQVLVLVTVAHNLIVLSYCGMYAAITNNMYMSSITALGTKHYVCVGTYYRDSSNESGEATIGIGVIDGSTLVLGSIFSFGASGRDYLRGVTSLDSTRIVFCGHSDGLVEGKNGCFIGVATCTGIRGITLNKIIIYDIGHSNYNYCIEALDSTRIVFCGVSSNLPTIGAEDCIMGLATILGDQITINKILVFGGTGSETIMTLEVMDSNRIIFGGKFNSSPTVGSYDCLLFTISDFEYETTLVNPAGWKLQKWTPVIRDWTPNFTEFTLPDNNKWKFSMNSWVCTSHDWNPTIQNFTF